MRSSRTRVTAGPKSPDRPTRPFRSLPPLYASYFFAVFFRCSGCARRCSSCFLSSGVNSAPKSSASNTWRISISKCKKRDRFIFQRRWRFSAFFEEVSIFAERLSTRAKADAAGRERERRHELADRVEHHLELAVVFLFELVQAFGQLFVGGNQFSQPYEGAHDMDAHVDRSWTIQHHCCHDGTMFCESIQQSPSASSPWL